MSRGGVRPLDLGTNVDDPAGASWDDNWAYSNIGVPLAPALGFSVTWFARRGRIRQQEQG